VTVEFGPSRSTRFERALADARRGAGECSEVEPGRHRSASRSARTPFAYTGLARLLERARHSASCDRSAPRVGEANSLLSRDRQVSAPG
jgi:hypothetical protein